MKPRIDLDYYAILGVSADADGPQIQKAYRRRAKRCHPDLFPIDSDERSHAETRFKLLNQAREILADPRLRAAYDATRPADPGMAIPYAIPVPPVAPGPYQPPYGRRRSATGGFDVQITFEDALRVAEEDAAAAEEAGVQVDGLPRARGEDGEDVEDAAAERRMEQADYYYERGWKYARYGRHQLALDCFRQAAFLDPSRKIPLWLHLYTRKRRDQEDW